MSVEEFTIKHSWTTAAFRLSAGRASVNLKHADGIHSEFTTFGPSLRRTLLDATHAAAAQVFTRYMKDRGVKDYTTEALYRILSLAESNVPEQMGLSNKEYAVASLHIISEYFTPSVHQAAMASLMAADFT